MSRVRMLDAGRFNRQLSVENPVETADGSGGFYKTYQATDAVWALSARFLLMQSCVPIRKKRTLRTR